TFSMIRSASFTNTSFRSVGCSADQTPLSNAARAEATAASTSLLSQAEMLAITSPLKGFLVAKIFH
ncbi:MAG: hypothetical protein ACJAZF_001659, partial [Granulosicoccus sp.]